MEQTRRQEIFTELVTGILLYSVVLGFFNDYTDILHTGTYSVTFALAVVMQLLTYATLRLKDRVVRHFKGRSGRDLTVAMALSVWLVIFLSKFVFLWVISVVFRHEVQINGFVGLVLIIITMTLAKQLLDYIYSRLAA